MDWIFGANTDIISAGLGLGLLFPGKPRLYEKGNFVMWTDPYISKQLLELHINPDHDIASRSRKKDKKPYGMDSG